MLSLVEEIVEVEVSKRREERFEGRVSLMRHAATTRSRSLFFPGLTIRDPKVLLWMTLLQLLKFGLGSVYVLVRGNNSHGHLLRQRDAIGGMDVRGQERVSKGKEGEK